MDYKQAGVDIEAGYRAVALMKEHIESTMRPEVLTDIGGFSGAFSMKGFMGMEEPTLVSGTDGVGTKLKLAFLLDKHDTIGIDCVAMCVNDIACAGGEPLFFLDYIACGNPSLGFSTIFFSELSLYRFIASQLKCWLFSYSKKLDKFFILSLLLWCYGVIL